MRKFFLGTVFFFSCLLAANAQDLIVHEWGTFTTLQGSDGKRLPGLYLEEEHLPSFVHHHEGFSPDALATKGIYKPAYNVTVKMETPVLYFYSPQETNFSVKVQFPAGSISQWYPHRTAGEADTQDTIDFAKKYNGWIQWDGKVLAPDSKEKFSPNPAELTNTWTAPRETDANLVTVKGETEKYLFYRGVGYFDVPLNASFNAAGQLVLKNLGADEIPYVFVYDKFKHEDIEKAAIWWTGKISPGEEKIVERSEISLSDAELKEKFLEFENALTAAGLYQKESAAMLNTWRQSYFGHAGLRVFWIVPEKLTEEILPLEMSPKPAELKRVLVGRSEVLTPEFEANIYADFASGKGEEKWMGDRYFLAYQARAQAIQQKATGVEEFSSDSKELEILPNPSSGKFTIKAELPDYSSVKISVTNLSGEKILSFEEKISSGILHKEISLEKFSSGTYLLTLELGSKQLVKKIIKE